ncbi:outer membrane beta-barrel family protein [Spirosoma luteolum]
MKKYLLFLLFVLTNVTFGQTIRGVVRDSRDQPIPFATVALLTATDSVLVRSVRCTDAGGYTLSGIKAGSYRLLGSAVGLEPIRSAVFAVPVGGEVTAPVLVLPEASRALGSVTVRARRPLVETLPDKLVLNVVGSSTSAGSTALELLQRAPGVLIDPNDNLTVQGKNGVRVYIDGKPSPLSAADLAGYLRTLQASDIEAIEIITQPSARYDAAGNAGIINIRLKKDKRFGSNGTLALGVAQGRYYPKLNGSLSLNHRTRAVNLFGTYSNRTARDWSSIQFYREQNGLFYDQRAETRTRSTAHNAKVGADWFVSPTSTLGVLLDVNARPYSSLTAGQTPIGTLGQAATQRLLANNDATGNRQNQTANLNYRFADTTGHELTIDVDYGRYRSDSRTNQLNQYVAVPGPALLLARDYRMDAGTTIDLRSLKLDYTQRLAGGTLGTGFKLSSVRTDNRFDFYDLVDSQPFINADRTNRFVYTERIVAGYASYNRTWGAWQGQAGLRVEQTHSDGELLNADPQQADARVVRQYTNLFPSAGLTYGLNKNNSLSLTYSRRIDRPSYQSLNPFESKLDELTYQKGNAFLRPQYTSTGRVAHTYNYKLTTGLSYSYTRDFFTDITDTTEQNRNYITTRNLASQRVLTLDVSYPFTVRKGWDVYVNVSAYRSTNRADFGAGRTIDLTANVLSLYLQQTVTLPNRWSAEVSGFYTSPSIWGGTFQNRRFWGSTVGVQHKLRNERGTVALTLTDPVNSQRWRGISQFGGLYMDASGGWESRQLRLNLTWNLGRQQVKKARQRTTGAADELGRMN